jgi:hypothetical protein
VLVAVGSAAGAGVDPPKAPIASAANTNPLSSRIETGRSFYVANDVSSVAIEARRGGK